ncbi:MAG: ferredoxin FdxA [Pontibacterium sp.]
MSYVVTEACIACRYTDCVEVCPVDCFFAGPNMLVIHPDECIDCGYCEPVCPVNAIYQEGEVPVEQVDFIALNEELCEKWPRINALEPPLAQADKFAVISEKRAFLER